MEVKQPTAMNNDWDYYDVLAPAPGDRAFIAPAESGCPLALNQDAGA